MDLESATAAHSSTFGSFRKSTALRTRSCLSMTAAAAMATEVEMLEVGLFAARLKEATCRGGSIPAVNVGGADKVPLWWDVLQ